MLDRDLRSTFSESLLSVMSLDILYSSVERPTVTLMTYNKNGFECLSKSINQYADMENVEGVNFALLLYSSNDVERSEVALGPPDLQYIAPPPVKPDREEILRSRPS